MLWWLENEFQTSHRAHYTIVHTCLCDGGRERERVGDKTSYRFIVFGQGTTIYSVYFSSNNTKWGGEKKIYSTRYVLCIHTRLIGIEYARREVYDLCALDNKGKKFVTFDGHVKRRMCPTWRRSPVSDR